MEDPVLYLQMAQHRNLFGDGMAGQRIASILMSYPATAKPYPEELTLKVA
jgi:UDP-N-acetylglucosamine 2-epimerase